VAHRAARVLLCASLAAVEGLIDRRALADPPLPVIPAGTYNVTAYGAASNNSAATNATDIDDAINAAIGNGGGTVIVPAGQTFVSNPITINGGNVNFQVNGTLQATPETDYPNASADFITWSNGSNSELSGSGTVDGQGATWWTAGAGGAPLSTRPELVHISNAQTMLITGLNLINSPKEFFNFGGSKTTNITFNGINVSAPGTSPNTDGMDIEGSNFLIENSTLSEGDDNIAIIAFPNNAATSNVLITNMTFGTGHGVSVGDEQALGISNITLTNSTFNGTTNGIRLKSGVGQGGVVQNLNYSNLTMTNVQNPIYMSEWYNQTLGGFVFPASPQSATSMALTPQWQNISISNLTSTNSASNSIAGLFYGLPESPIEGVTMTDVNITAALGMSLDYAGTEAAPIVVGADSVIDPTGGGPLYGTFSNPNDSNPGTLSTPIYDSVLVTPEPATAVLGLLPLVMMRSKRNFRRGMRWNGGRSN